MVPGPSGRPKARDEVGGSVPAKADGLEEGDGVDVLRDGLQVAPGDACGADAVEPVVDQDATGAPSSGDGQQIDVQVRGPPIVVEVEVLGIDAPAHDVADAVHDGPGDEPARALPEREPAPDDVPARGTGGIPGRRRI